ncbi:helix-turn-helix domain-containing protein [Nonomuraea diastatica]|uniref:Helix-turn-helix domain-containing protein n=2 Tax=Nonomuraea diastatica TaxID=1848329 RepID=A0A4R4WI82_9ACTN|nr:helix-turn-helix domain-containing protein [Nonomuraea diastatica]
MTVTGKPESSGMFAADATTPGTVEARFGHFWREWEEQLGMEHPVPDFTPGSTGDFRISARAVTAHDSLIADVYSESLIGTNTSSPRQSDEQVVMHVVRHNAWRFARPRQGEHTVPAGHFMLHRSGPPTFEEARRTTATVLLLPASPLSHLIQDRLIAGPASSAEMRLLLGQLNLVDQNARDLTPAGALAARDALLELVKGVLRQQADGTEPHLGPALAQAAKDLADSRLADPDLSPSMLARELGVSVRTLYRAFAAVEDSVARYIRRRRLEQARLELLNPVGRPSVAELAAHWQFADSSHFIRAFKSQYGRTPVEFARTATHPGRVPAQ